ncbi:hypothetical protein BO71DRAFT_400053 [Aspergillus ellipticus CBS 707.79]|uniref:Uncharacterized protein n=1 Tax=Aspergillus ellipticus CBS 707.79 TaxID=1448320 RepID=A0A319EQ51_9EURO|nr:hypothetical protein BO71DRAFT_400053 [Aspergillus ellipticus CBS 707.79]
MSQIFIAVFVGDPLDYAKKRHTAVYVTFPDGDQSLLHIVGSHGFFEYKDEVGKDPQASARLATLIHVSTLTKTTSKPDIKAACQRTKIWNELGHRDWNCQNWVGDALDGLVAIGCVTAEERRGAVDKMVEACVEAKDG